MRRTIRAPGRSGHWVDAPGMPRMAPAHAPASEPGPACGPVLADRLEPVVRARRVKPAARSKQRAYRELIGTDQYPQHRFHPRDHSSNRISSSRSAWRSARAGGGAACTWTTTSRPGSGGEMRRKVSRTIRLSRLRCTALATTRRGTTTPIRLRPAVFADAATVNQTPRLRRGERSVSLNCSGRRNRAAEGKPWFGRSRLTSLRPPGACALWRAGRSAPSFLPAFSCAHETRACGHAGSWTVDRYASSRVSSRLRKSLLLHALDADLVNCSPGSAPTSCG